MDLVNDLDGTIDSCVKLDISTVKSKTFGNPVTMTINASIQEICKMGLSKSGFQQFIVLRDDVDTIKVFNSS